MGMSSLDHPQPRPVPVNRVMIMNKIPGRMEKPALFAQDVQRIIQMVNATLQDRFALCCMILPPEEVTKRQGQMVGQGGTGPVRICKNLSFSNNDAQLAERALQQLVNISDVQECKPKAGKS
ncbi:hypothetical protein chiPu_0015314 [Chiloscyllium punctatum]|uniref:Uncharacterized protein n=1 Tax=Chiloscyllium punctatum TaxID=137246 RepID=A0A401T2I0_CHIPU|nr:hypothetical protein [Chiloscyllium punctatum]